MIFVSQLINLQSGRIRVENSQAGLFTKQGWTSAYTKVNSLGFGQFRSDTAVLRHSSFRYIQARHDLDPGSNLAR